MSDTEKANVVKESEDDKVSKSSSSDATAPQTSPARKIGVNADFHHHVVPTEKSGALNVYIQVSMYLTWDIFKC